jgi:uncharacterized protein (DUF433 family)
MTTITNDHITNEQEIIVRTDRGLAVSGTRITLYAILDYLHAEWPPKLIQDWLNLTDAQMAGVLAYLDEHRNEVEAEYQQVEQEAAKIREYWETRNHQRRTAPDPEQLTSEQRVLWKKLQDWKHRIAQDDHNRT